MKFNGFSLIKRAITIICLAWAISGPTHAIGLANDPLFLNVAVDPNIVVTLDDSGSMQWSIVPDALIDAALDTSRRLRSSTFNALYYNPRVTYMPPKNAAGVSYPNATFSAAWVNGLDPAKGTINLSRNYMASLRHDPSATATYGGRTGGYDLVFNTPADTGTVFNFGTGTTVPYYGRWNGGGYSVYTRGVAAYYYNYVSANAGCTAGDYNDEDCYTYVRVPNAEETNFANWYSFYRNRVLATASGALLAFNDFPTNVRLAWQSLTTCQSFGGTCTDKVGANYDNKIRQFSGTHRSNFLTWLTQYPATGWTPLRDAMVYAGNYYKTSGIASPYAENPQVTAGTAELSCRKNYHIMFTDGVWNMDTQISGTNAPGNADNTSITALPDSIAYNTGDATATIFKDSNSNSVADLAFKYWATDLRTDLTNDVVPRTVDRSGTATQQYWNPKNNPATWQNMSTYTVGLGMTGTLVAPNPVWSGSTFAGAGYTDLSSGAKSWPLTGDSVSPGNVYDLWHAAINSRGEFFSVESPSDLVTALKNVVSSILDATPSAAALAANSTSIQTGSLVYQARFDSKDWSGDLIAFPVQADGSVGSAVWQSKSLMPAPGSRTIFTISGGSGTVFTNCAALSTAQKTALDTDSAGTNDGQCTSRLNWLRGTSVTGMRTRTTILGDIINSDPVYTHAEDLGYGSAAFSEASSYAAFITGKSSRIPMVYVGGNDGMLHGFRGDIGAGDSGVEKFAFIPDAVYPNLSKLTNPSYVHKYFVDGGPTVGDAYSGTWKTYLVSGLGAGGKSVFALDVSNPGSPSTGMVKWEFTDVDMGYSFSKPQIGRLPDGSWVAIFGNGYNSTSGNAYLYIVNIATGALIQKIPAGSAVNNGLSTAVLHDSNGDKVIDTAYAGDLQGNLWKFDLSATITATWGVANSGQALFQARNDLGQTQPITAQPVVGGNPAGGAMVYVGTGVYLGTPDILDATEHSFYGIWDNGTAILTTNRSELQEQTIIAQTTEFGVEARETSTTTVTYPSKRGWYMDFDIPTPVGERVVTQALLRYGRVIFLTLIPSVEVCQPGGASWLMELDALSGAATPNSNFDFNNDGLFDASDNLASGGTAAGVRTTVGITKPPAWFIGADGKDFKIMTGTTGGIQSTGNKGAPPPPPGTTTRIYWRQIQ
ncbi:MAG: pilus assembly protein [Thiobacillus sp.]